ncbi:MAG TPA: hypothetical protein DCG34_10680, partial [Clostridiales bacterium]|nr:hypothetical protein [Clostridiales bacterium]
MDKRREQILDMIKREFIGPDPLKDLKGMVQNNGEEILTSDPPRTRYLAGILFPQESLVEKNDIFEDDQIDYNSSCEEIVVTNPDKENVSSGKNELLENLEELMNLSYAYKQSAMSLTLTIKRNSIVTIDLHGAKYESLNQKDFESGFSKTYYYRKPFCWNNDNKPLELPSHRKRMLHYTISKNDVEQNIKLHITYRNQVNKFDADTYTFTMENTNIMDGGVIRDSDCFFQCGFKLHCQNGFSIMPENPRVNIEDQDYESNRLLYRHIKKYGIGHGCSVDWSFDNGHVTKVWTEIFPSYEIKPIVPSTIDGVSLEMHKMANQGSIDEVYREMDLMCSSYYEWIEDLVEDSKKLDDHNETAKKHIDNCKSCYDRMVDGVLLLRSNEKVRKAFMLMNEVMLMQQLHYNLPLSEWDFDDNNNVFLNKKYEFLPNKDDTKTWFGDIKRYGKWRPFQLAFILINLRSMFEKNSKSRDIVDLIWFPTGGGKTEAYLGLSAYTIFIRRLLNREDFGTTILMRYTLRLLTAQQYERAATMICACEMIRSKNVSELGEKRITIGLWVGVSTTPNRMSDAVKAYESLYAGSKDENPFIMLKCPWCGAQMGLIRKGHNKTIRGYKKTNERNKKIVFQCHNEECDFSKDGNSLPLMVVDEAIYEKPPTLLLGTVDKFAMLPYRPEAQNIFGIYNGVRKSSPDLIIQDELHLISGPLGSMVGHYETMVNELCIDRRNHSIVKPKIIASTATISKAKEQCHALYACGENNVFQFPPSGLSAGDSFFAYEDAAGIGRKYVGIFAPASSSLSTTSIRLYASLLYAANNIDVDTQSEKDPYWTNLAYFNSLRELGQTATWINADITEYLHVIYRRRREDLDSEKYSKRRYINRYEELTSRIRGDKIPENLQELG